MGVHELWSIIEPVRESVPLYSLSGKTLAVDLSLWVCEAQHVQAMMGRVTKPHLRNLFFRVSSLTLMGVKLVFVMEGEAPKLKAETMKKRTEMRTFGGVKKAAPTMSTKNTSRGRFNAVLRECATMLDYLGVPWVTAAGEAEAMCAYLDSQGLVDGCITNDGDAFLYGAQTVYRNFNMNSKDPQVDCYRTCRVQTKLQLCRENLVGLAILLGCDYIPKGVSGVGREQALRLIKMLKGQTLLQRFNQWKEENCGVSEGAVKKVTHCHVCRHPGSAKAHERSGCVLCNSKHFCEPQDYDYQCPCDWHRYEQTRQAMSFEANLRKKTLASQQFPFTEIICEFLISKDKPVSHFKRRQPNMLQIQQFAFQKMEWPKHYTSEKVLVLMTYAELINRKCVRDSASQIKPLRIHKPRVRNGIACFEIIWTPPEHFVFPEDRPAGEKQEVRTVEEESLFRVAYPEVVESYVRDKALAEENKKKKKRPKNKKPSDDPDGLVDLLSLMTLQSSSNSPPQTLTPVNSNTEDSEVLVLDTPVKNEQQVNSKEEQSTLGDGPNSCLSYDESNSVASPSVSAVIDALHLSDINWDSSSFTSSPTSQSPLNQTNEQKMSKNKERKVTEAEGERISDVKESKSAQDICFTVCPLRERVLMRNTVKELAPLKHSSSYNSKQNGLITNKGGKMSGKESVVKKEEPLEDRKQSGIDKAEQSLKSAVQTHLKIKDSCNVSKKAPHKYKFVKKSSSSSATLLQRNQSDPGQSEKDRKVPETSKKSVCMSVCSSSEESDTENKQLEKLQRKAKSKTVSKIKSSSLSSLSLRTVSAPNIREKATHCNQPHRFQVSLVPKLKSHSETNSKFSKSEEVSAADVEVFSPTPASPMAVLDSDDSVICGESPLPLAERLRLKFLK